MNSLSAHYKANSKFVLLSFVLLMLGFVISFYFTYKFLADSGHPLFEKEMAMPVTSEFSTISFLKQMGLVLVPLYLGSMILLIAGWVKKETTAIKYIASVFHVGILVILLLSFFV